MNWRALALCASAAAALSLTAVPDIPAKDHGECGGRAGYLYGGSGQHYGGECGQIYRRIDFDRSKIDEIGPTGRHRKALQWYVDDLRNAERDLDRCRYGADAAAGYYPSDPRDGYDDSDDADPSFDWKRDWPALLGAVLYPSR